MESYSFSSLANTREELINGTFSAQDLCAHYLNKIKEGDQFNAFLEVFDSSAMALAKSVDESISNNSAGKLAGAIIAIKDNMCYAGHRVSAASKILGQFESLYTATAVQRLVDEGAIIVGRLNCDEFAMGSSNENSAFGGVKNPIDTTLVPGGSSGGSAAAVAAGLCMTALGSDTGGSIRQPASFCGVVGVKPTYGRVSRSGLVAFASSFDQIGPLSLSVEDGEAVYNVMAGYDALDSTSCPDPLKLDHEPKRHYSFSYYKEVIESPGLKPEIRTAFLDKLEALKAAGHTVTAASFPYLDKMVPCYYVLTTAEASSNLARYDGVHYGVRSPQAEDIPSTYFNSRTEGFGEEVKRRIMLGTFVLSTGYYDAYYAKAQKVRALIKKGTEEVLNSSDFLLSPTTPHPAFALGEKSNDPIALYLEDIFTVQANLAGNPAISIPLSQTESGLPFGLHIMSKSYDESGMFHIATELSS